MGLKINQFSHKRKYGENAESEDLRSQKCQSRFFSIQDKIGNVENCVHRDGHYLFKRTLNLQVTLLSIFSCLFLGVSSIQNASRKKQFIRNQSAVWNNSMESTGVCRKQIFCFVHIALTRRFHQCRLQALRQAYQNHFSITGDWSGGGAQRSFDPGGGLSPKFAQNCIKTA